MQFKDYLSSRQANIKSKIFSSHLKESSIQKVQGILDKLAPYETPVNLDKFDIIDKDGNWIKNSWKDAKMQFCNS